MLFTIYDLLVFTNMTFLRFVYDNVRKVKFLGFRNLKEKTFKRLLSFPCVYPFNNLPRNQNPYDISGERIIIKFRKI